MNVKGEFRNLAASKFELLQTKNFTSDVVVRNFILDVVRSPRSEAQPLSKNW